MCYADVYKDGTGVVEFLRYDDMKSSIRKLDDSKFRSHEVRFGLLYTPSSAFNGVKHILLRLVHSVTLCYVPFSRYPENFVHILPYQFPSDLLYVRRTRIILCRTDFRLLFSQIELRFFFVVLLASHNPKTTIKKMSVCMSICPTCIPSSY